MQLKQKEHDQNASSSKGGKRLAGVPTGRGRKNLKTTARVRFEDHPKDHVLEVLKNKGERRGGCVAARKRLPVNEQPSRDKMPKPKYQCKACKVRLCQRCFEPLTLRMACRTTHVWRQR